MKQTLGTLFLIFLALSACSRAPSPQPVEPSIPPHTAIPLPTNTAQPSPTPVPTATHISEPNSGYLFEWPISPLTAEQIQEVLNCQSQTWSDDYRMDTETIIIDNPTTVCDSGLFSISKVQNFDNPKLSESALAAAEAAIFLNPGIIFANPYFFFIFHKLDIVNPPPLTNSPLKGVHIQYEWGGMGRGVDFDLTIKNEKSSTAIGQVNIGSSLHTDEGEPYSFSINQEVNKQFVQSLGQSLYNLIPVNNQTSMFACFDNYPDWIIHLDYEDNSQIILRTNESNFFLEGGPFQTEINGQNYILASYKFNIALLEIIDQLQIPLGEPAGMACSYLPFADLLYTDVVFP